MCFNGHKINPDETNFSVATNSYSFQARIQAAAGEEKTDVGAFINLLGTQASGVLGIGDRSFNIQLDPVKVWFDVNISMDAGAYFSTGNRALKWDTTSSNWKSATWETAGLTFGYNTKNIGDELQPRWAAENTFIDNCRCSFLYPNTPSILTSNSRKSVDII